MSSPTTEAGASIAARLDRLLDDYGSAWVFTVVAAAMLLLVIDVGALGGRSTGRSVDAVGDESVSAEPARR